MALILRNKNRHIYTLRLKTQRTIYSNPFILKNYLKLKEVFIRYDNGAYNENAIFRKVFIETISYCNNDCAFCPASTSVKAKRPVNLMPEDLYLKIINELADISFRGSLAFHCNNEPLLDRRLAPWIKIARSLLKNNLFYLYTNGTLVDIDAVNELFAAGLDRIIVNNYNDRYELIPSVKSLIDNVPELRGEVIINYRLKTEYLGNRAGQSPNAARALKAPLEIICVRPLREIVVGYDGTVPLCCADALWKITMGNVQKISLKEVWSSERFKEIRRSLARGNRACTDICRACDALSLSTPGGIRE